MKFNVSFFRNENGYIYCQIYFGGSKAVFSTHIQVSKNQWHNGNPKGEQAQEIRKKLNHIRTELEKCFDYLKAQNEFSGTKVSPQEVKNLYLKKFQKMEIVKQKSVIEIILECEKYNHELGKTNKRTYKNNLALVERLRTCFEALGKKDIPFEEINIKFLNEVFAWLKKAVFRKGKLYEKEKKNTYLKRYKQLLERGNKYALACEYTSKILPPFGNFTDDSEITPYLSENELERIIQLDLQHCPDLEQVRDVFVFSVFTTLNFADMKNFDAQKHIVEVGNEKMIIIPRQKTKNLQQIPVFPIVWEILQKYDFKLPLTYPQDHNRKLKLIAKLAGINTDLKNIQNRSARTTGATYYRNKGIEFQYISKVLGHSRTSTTEKHYARLESNSILRAFKVLNSNQKTGIQENEADLLNSRLLSTLEKISFYIENLSNKQQ
ncbi:MAG: phage integrase SAM-like domain-containing protein [Raineya sp.]|nr:phage integrase SAM-like domain-containing protein [Raineya sp.]